MIVTINYPCFSNVYKLYEDGGKRIGSVTIYTSGAYAGKTVIQSWNANYTKRDVIKLFNEWRKKQ